MVYLGCVMCVCRGMCVIVCAFMCMCGICGVSDMYGVYVRLHVHVWCMWGV